MHPMFNYDYITFVGLSSAQMRAALVGFRYYGCYRLVFSTRSVRFFNFSDLQRIESYGPLRARSMRRPAGTLDT